MVQPEVKCFFHKDTFTCQYVVHDPSTMKGVIIDSVYDFEPAASRFTTTAADELMAYCKEKGIDVVMLLDTHAHADHVTGAGYLRHKTGVPYGIGEHIVTVQSTFAKLFNLKEGEFKADGTQFDRLFKDGDTFAVGSIAAKVMHTPGHTPACVSYVIGDAVFVGDTLFMPDFGSARCDFPAGSAKTLFESIHKLFTLPDATRVFVGHDYAPNGREYKWETTIGESKRDNKHVNASTKLEDFTEWRTGRDKQLGAPRLILPSLQVNIRGGELPVAEDNGIAYLKLPINKI